MKGDADRRGFWTGGPEEQRKLLEEEMAAELSDLESELERATDPAEIARLEAAMSAVRSRYAKKERESDGYVY